LIIKKHISSILLWIGIVFPSVAQLPPSDYPFQEPRYDFIRYDLNRISQFRDSSLFESFYEKMDRLFERGEGKINIVQFGGSHVQADIHTGRLRTRLQTFYPGVKGSRGFLFPFKAAGTNNPYNYTVQYYGTWKSCRNVQATPCDLGVAGISITTSDSVSGFTVYSDVRYAEPYDFNRFRIYHNTDNLSFEIQFGDTSAVDFVWTNKKAGYTEFKLNRYADTLNVKIIRSPHCVGDFTVYGFQMFNDDPGFVFHSIGVNGAAVPSYLKCIYLVKQLRELQPDLVIFSIGVNDAHGSNFSPAAFEANYEQLIAMVREAAPQTAILFITNNDTYFRKKYVNPNAAAVQGVMNKLAGKYGFAVWDLFSIMGGYGSMGTWDKNGLAASDRIHFTRAGYTLIGDLMFDAMLKGYLQHVELNNKKN
jgi:lysophospholipase L1-like esterase